MSTKKKKVSRFFKKDGIVFSDTFKLEQSSFHKNISFDANAPLLVPVEHCHFFHTFDSYGKVMKQSNKVGGHYHEVTVEEVDGKLVGKCSVQIGGMKDDKHTHEINYIKSDEVTLRTINKEAQEHIARMI